MKLTRFLVLAIAVSALPPARVSAARQGKSLPEGRPSPEAAAQPPGGSEALEKLYSAAEKAYSGGDFSGLLNLAGPLAEKGLPQAQTILGEMYRDGEGVPGDEAEAVKWFRKAAGQGDREGQLNLAVMCHLGKGVEKNVPEAIIWYLRAAEQNSPAALAALGDIYRGGDGVLKDLAKAAEYYRKAASLNSPLARARLGELYYEGAGVAQDFREAYLWFALAAGDDNKLAQYYLGRMYGSGEGVAQDLAAAEKWFLKAADGGFPPAEKALAELKGEKKSPGDQAALSRRLLGEANRGEIAAMAEMGKRYYEGNGIPRNFLKAQKWLKKAAGKGSREAELTLAEISTGIKKPAKGAAGAEAVSGNIELSTAPFSWIEELAAGGDAGACFFLGVMKLNGLLFPVDRREALNWYIKAAENGHAAARFSLAGMYEKGIEVKQDDAAAAYWYEKAALQGNAEAQYALANLYRAGRGVKKDDAAAVRWYEKAAENGSADAKLSLAFIYGTGEGVAADTASAGMLALEGARARYSTPDFNPWPGLSSGLIIPADYYKAVKWLRETASRGKPEAELALGIACAIPSSDSGGDSEAAGWFRQAAEKGNADAQFNLALLYLRGRGVKRDYIQAYRWMALAEALGHPRARAVMRVLQDNLDPGQVANAQKLSARDWDKMNP